MRRTLLSFMPLLALLIPACGGGSDYVIKSASVTSFSTPDTIAEGETLEVEVTVNLPHSAYSFSHFENEVNIHEKIILVRPFVRERLGVIASQMVWTKRVVARFEGLTVGDWDVYVDDPRVDWGENVTVLPSP